MPAIRRSGGVVAWFWDGSIPDPQDPEFAAALEQHRFRTIEHAASEEVSVGWITPGDPTGDSFDAEDMMAGAAGTWLRLRIDKKTLPRKWLQIHRDAAEKLRGRKLSQKDRKELRDGLMDQLLPRVLPTVQLVDVLLVPRQRTALLFTTTKGVCDAFGSLFLATFAVPLERGDPHRMALQAGLDRELLPALDRIAPVPWPREARPRRTAAAVTDLDAEPMTEEAEA